MKKLIKKISIILSIVIIACLFTGCNSSKKVVNFLNYGENIDDETLKEFQEKYDIKVNVDTFDDMETMYNKIKTGAANYDVILVSDNLMERMINEDLVQELNKENIPNINQMSEEYLNLSIDVVTEKVDSWDILWNEKYKNQIFMFNTYRDTIGVALKKLGYSLNSENKDEIEEAKNLLLSQKKLGTIYGSDYGTESIASGETVVNMIWSGEGLNLQDEYDNLEYVVPKEGANFWIDSLCIPKSAKNVEGAEKFINFVSDKESALRIADEIGYTTPNKEAMEEQDDSIKNNPNAYMPKEIMDRCELYKDLPKDVKKVYDEAWTEIGVESSEE